MPRPEKDSAAEHLNGSEKDKNTLFCFFHFPLPQSIVSVKQGASVNCLGAGAQAVKEAKALLIMEQRQECRYECVSRQTYSQGQMEAVS